MVRRALPGDYRLELGNLAKGTYRVEIFLNWGREEESRRMFILTADGGGRVMEAGVVEIGFLEA